MNELNRKLFTSESVIGVACASTIIVEDNLATSVSAVSVVFEIDWGIVEPLFARATDAMPVVPVASTP